MGASLICCTEETVGQSEDGVEGRPMSSVDVVSNKHQARPEVVRPYVVDEDKLSGIFVPSKSIPRCSSYYGVAVAPPPATPRCQSFMEVAPTQVGPSETTTRLPSLPEDEVHVAPEPCKWDPVFLGLMLMHLEKAEDLAYGEAFGYLAGDDSEVVPLDSPELHNFLLANSTLTSEALEPAVRRAAVEEEGGLGQAGFLELLREHAVRAEAVQSWFTQALDLGTASSDKELTQESCLAGLRLFVANEAQRLPQSALDESQLERICSSAMKQASEEISFEEWTVYCNKVARTISLARYASLGNGF